MKEEASVAWEVQYRNNESDPWQVLSDRDETEEAAERRIAGLLLKNPQTRTWFRVVKVTREPQTEPNAGVWSLLRRNPPELGGRR